MKNLSNLVREYRELKTKLKEDEKIIKNLIVEVARGRKIMLLTKDISNVEALEDNIISFDVNNYSYVFELTEQEIKFLNI